MKITVNGREYDSWGDVPEETRHLLGRVLPDDDGNGVPDAFEGKAELGRHTYRKVMLSRPSQVPAPPEEGRRKVRFMSRSTTTVAAPASATDQSVVPEGKIMLNGELVDANSEQPKTHWWHRG